MSGVDGPICEVARHPLPSGLIHDLRTPLNHIIGYSEMMMEETQEATLADLLPHLQKVCAAGHHMLSLINENFLPGVASEPPERSRARQGATVPLQLAPPAAAAVEELAASDAASASARGSMLVVDDIAANRDVLSRRLKSHGYAVAVAESGPEALEMLHAYTFDVVLLDIMMPEMDGFEVLRRLKADDALRHIAVVVVSSVTEVELVERCLEMGADDYLSKPFNSTLLQARIGACLERKRARDRESYLVEQLRENSRRLKRLTAASEATGARA